MKSLNVATRSATHVKWPAPNLSARASRPWLVMILALAVWLRLPGLFAPFSGDVSGWTGAFYGTMGRNILLLGTLSPVMTPIPSQTDAVAYFFHPPLVPWVVAAAFLLLGESEFAARLPFLLCSLLAVAWIYRICHREMGMRFAGVVAALLLATTPVAVVYGHQVEVVGSLLLFCMLGTLLAYLDCGQAPIIRSIVRLCLWATALILADWPGMLLLVILVAHSLFSRDSSVRVGIWLGGVTLCVLLVLVFWLVSIAPENGWQLLARKLFQRSYRLVTDRGKPFGVSTLVQVYLEHHRRMIGPLLMALGLWWVFQARRWNPAVGTAPLSLALFALAFMLVACQSLVQHDFWLHPLAATYAVIGASALMRTAKRPGMAVGLILLTTAGNLYMTHQTRQWMQRPNTSGPADADSHHHLARWVAGRVPESDLVAVIDWTWWPTLPYYLNRKLIPISSLSELKRLNAAPIQVTAMGGIVPAISSPRWLLTRTPPDGGHLNLIEQRAGWWLYRLSGE